MRHQLQLPTAGRVWLAAQVMAGAPFLFVLGSGAAARDPLWDGENPPVPPIGATSVTAPFGFLRPAAEGFAEADADGIIRADGVRYRQSTDPTRYPWWRLDIDQSDFAGASLREIGLFAGVTLAPGVPAGKLVLDAADIADPGTLLLHDFVERVVMTADETLDRDFVLRI